MEKREDRKAREHRKVEKISFSYVTNPSTPTRKSITLLLSSLQIPHQAWLRQKEFSKPS